MLIVVVFGLGFLVYDGLLLKQIHDKQLRVTRDGHSSYFWVHYIHIVFHLAQTYFIFKHPQVSINVKCICLQEVTGLSPDKCLENVIITTVVVYITIMAVELSRACHCVCACARARVCVRA